MLIHKYNTGDWRDGMEHFSAFILWFYNLIAFRV